MLRAHDTDAENVAPTNLPRNNAFKSTSRKPLGVRPPLSAAKQDKTPQPTAVQSKRRALGDITNRREGNISATKPKPTLKGKASLSDRSFPRDRSGNIEEPHYIPDPMPTVYEPPALFDEEELASLQRVEEKHEIESPDLESLFGRLKTDRPAPMLNENEEFDVLEDRFDTFEKRVVFSREDFLPMDIDDLTLADGELHETL